MIADYQLEELTIELTTKCPMHCLLCSSNGGEKEPNELPFQEQIKLVDDAKKIGLQRVSISGGEPFEYPYLIEFIEHLINLELKVSVYTCGNVERDNAISSLDSKKLKKLKELSIDNLIFSIHGHNSYLHDYITGKEGSFSNLMKSIETARSYSLDFEFHFVPTKLNYFHLPEISQLAKLHGASKLSILRFVPQGRGKVNKELLDIPISENAIFKSILNDVIQNSQIEIRLGSPFNCFHLSCGKRCSAGLDKAIIRPDGYVFPCVGMKRIFPENTGSDARSKNISDIWKNSPLFTNIRKRQEALIESNCSKCGYFNSCFGGCLTQKIINETNNAKTNDPYCEVTNVSEISQFVNCIPIKEEKSC